MKFYKISELLKYREIKLNKRRTYNNSYNDFRIRNNKKENIRMNQLFNESELYSFSPLINHSGYMTYRANNNRNFTHYINRNSFYRKNNFPINQKYYNYNNDYPYSMQRNLLTENCKVDNTNYNEYDSYINNNNDNYPNDYFLTNINNVKRNNLNRTDYGFYSPINKKRKKGKNLYSNNYEDINNKIYEYLNNFESNKKRIDMLNPKNIYNNTYSSKKRNKSINNISKGNIYDNLYPENYNNNLYNVKYKNNGELENYFNKKNNNNKYNTNLKLNNERLNFKKNQNNNKNNNKNNKSILQYNNKNNQNDEEDKISKFSNNNKDLSKKNSNTSLNPSSYGIDHMKTYYTNKPKTSNNNINIATSNVNSTSSRMLDTQYHFLNGLKMKSGEVNEYFYDFNSGRKGNKDKDKNDDQRSVQSLQSLSDSKMMELANHYLSEEDNSEENYQMNNIIYHRKKHNVK